VGNGEEGSALIKREGGGVAQCDARVSRAQRRESSDAPRYTPEL